jgi:hypothetical protein
MTYTVIAAVPGTSRCGGFFLRRRIRRWDTTAKMHKDLVEVMSCPTVLNLLILR